MESTFHLRTTRLVPSSWSWRYVLWTIQSLSCKSVIVSCARMGIWSSGLFHGRIPGERDTPKKVDKGTPSTPTPSSIPSLKLNPYWNRPAFIQGAVSQPCFSRRVGLKRWRRLGQDATPRPGFWFILLPLLQE